MELQGAVAVVTGATGGLGQRIGRALAAQGAHVAGIYQTSQEQAKGLVAEWSALGARSAAFQADVTDPASIQQMVERILAEFGRIDILVNNAAYNQLVPFKDLDGMTLEEVAEHAGMSVSGVRKRLRTLRARALSPG